MKRRETLSGIILIIALAPAPAAFAQELPPWDQAMKTWESGMSQYRSHLYDQAATLFEEFLRKYPGHEYASGTYLYLASARNELGDANGWEAAVDQVIKKFPNSGAWFQACTAKLGALKVRKKNDEYVAFLETMLRTCKELPMDLAGSRLRLPYGVWYVDGPGPRTGDALPWLVDSLKAPGMEQDIVQMADTPERAEKALKALALTFKHNAKEMEPTWEFAHYLLLKQAGKADEADKTLKGYAAEWGADPRGLGLVVLQAEYAQGRGEDAAADALYAQLRKDYSAYGSVSIYLGKRLDCLRDKKRLDDYTALAEFYLKTWPRGTYRWKVFDNWLDLLRPKAVAGDAEAYKKSQDLWERWQGKDSYDALQWLIDVNLARKDSNEALALAEKLAQPAYWSSQTFNLLQKYAARDEALQKVVAGARKRYEIPVGDPNAGPAGEMLARLIGRINEDQTRHMEELGAEMLDKYPKEPATIEAVKRLVDYYFTKLLPEPRDRWIACMIGTYKLHPLTQQVMVAQATAANAAKKFDELAMALDNLRSRFPTAPYDYWMQQRLSCFDAAKDPVGKAAFAKKHYGADAEAGDLKAIGELARHEVALLDGNHRKIGDYWKEKASKLPPGSLAELYCLYQSVDGYCYAFEPLYMRNGARKNLLVPEGLAELKRAQTRAQDPEFAWCLEWADVNVQADNGNAKAALDALKERLKDKKVRDLCYRLDMDALTRCLDDGNVLAREGIMLGERFSKACYTQVDETALNAFLGRLWASLKDYERAARCYAKVIDDCPWPEKVLWAAGEAIGCLRGNPGQTEAFAERYLNKTGHVQDTVLPVWLSMAEDFYSGNRDAFMAMAGRLAQRYPASIARGWTVQKVQSEQKRP